jgi:predicted nucleic acid-binding protein
VIVVADAGPIIHLSLIGRIDLLPTLYGRILVPGLVYQEVVRQGTGLPGSAELDGADWTDRVDPAPESSLFDLLRVHLDPGEAAAICVAVERGAGLILSDDRQARLTAARLGKEVKGTLGILVEAKRRGEIGAVAPALAALKRGGTWLSDRLVERILAEVDEL